MKCEKCFYPGDMLKIPIRSLENLNKDSGEFFYLCQHCNAGFNPEGEWCTVEEVESKEPTPRELN